MTFTPQDITVAVLAHKRPQLLEETLRSYRAQTIQGFRLLVVSNGDCPAIKEVSARYQAELAYEPNELAMYTNIQRALDLASGKLTVLAHDDDLVEPDYLAALLHLFNQFDDLSLVIPARYSEERPWNSAQRYYMRFDTPARLAGYIFSGGSFTFSSFCAKTEILKKADTSVVNTYGKVADVNLMLQNFPAQHASACIAGPFIKYRLHADQDCVDYSTGPTMAQWLHLTAFYHRLLTPLRRTRWVFYVQVSRYLRAGWYDWCKCEHKNHTYREFLQTAAQQGLLPWQARLCGLLLRGKISHYLQNKLLKIHFTAFKDHYAD